MFDPHAQQIRHLRKFERDGPNVAKLDKAVEMRSRSMWHGQCETRENKKLDKDNKIVYVNNFLTPTERITYIQKAFMYERSPAKEGGEHNKMEFTRNGKPYAFSPFPHKTIQFTEHISELGRKTLTEIQKMEVTEHDLMDSATEIEYGVGMPNGGTINKTNDTDGEWKHIAFLGLGQTRFLRITKDGARGFINIPLHDNALIILSGSDFQKHYYHQVDDLSSEHPLGDSMLIKMRFRKPLLSGTKTI
tara:strand:- start:108 stop:848 length:741 start_codon:yes stop_codon:yes gene_type:complete